MRILSITLLITSIISVILSALNLRIFSKLKFASVNYPTSNAFDDACNVSKKYIDTNIVISSIMFSVTSILMIFSSFIIYKQY